MRLIDADVLIYHFGEVDDNDTKRWDLFITAEEMGEQPTVDAVPVIRCCDCKHWNYRGDTHRCFVWCVYVGENGFCHRAERRDNDHKR